MYITVFNPTDQPVVVDDEGRTVAGHSWSPALSTADEVKTALDDGRLVKVSANPATKDLDEDAKQALEATAELESARKKSPQETAKVAEEVGATKTSRARAAAQEA